MPRWRWANVPLPEAHLVGLGAGFLVQRIAPWTLAYVGIALVADAAWPLLLLPVVLAVTHIVIVREERSLERRFGAAYRSYKRSVRRYL